MLNSLIFILQEMSPYLLLGFLFAGVLHVYVPSSFWAKHLSANNLSSVLKATLFGIPLPLCSCGVIPTAASLRNDGVSRGATVAFLIATPQTGIDSIMATYGILGLPFAIARPLAALLTASFGGALVNRAERRSAPSMPTSTASCPSGQCKCPPRSIARSIVAVLRYGFIDMVRSTGKWLVVGLAVAALITAAVPSSFFERFAQWPLLSMLLVLVVSVPMYLCATGSIPIAAALILKGLSPGAGLVMLMAGPACSFASIMVMSRVLGRRALIIYLASIMAGSIACGLAIDYLLPREWFTQIVQAEACCHLSSTPVWRLISSIVLLGLIANALVTSIINKYKVKSIMDNQTIYHVGGMSCNHCKKNVESGLMKLDGVEAVEANVERGEVVLTGIVDEEQVRQAVEALGYEYGGQA